MEQIDRSQLLSLGVMERINHPENPLHMQVIEGIIGAPGTGKTGAARILEHSMNLGQIAGSLGLQRELHIAFARKSTSRAGRGADDRFKIAGVPEEDFTEQNYLGIYTLANNGAKYAYQPSEFDHGADLIVAEPSLHHIESVKAHLGPRLTTVLLVGDRNYRATRMNERGTEDPRQIQQRLVEGDAQVFVADKLTGGIQSLDGTRLDAGRLIDDGLHDKFLELYLAHSQGQGLDGARLSFYDFLCRHVGGEMGFNDPDVRKYAAGASREYDQMISHAATAVAQHDTINHIVALDESYVVLDEQPGQFRYVTEGRFRDELIDITLSVMYSRIQALNKDLDASC